MMDHVDISDRLRVWLEQKLKASGKSQTELAQALGLSPSAVSRVLKGERQISASELIQTAIILRASVKELDGLMATTLDEALGPGNKLSPYMSNPEYQRDLAFEQMGVYRGDQNPIHHPNLLKVTAYEDDDVCFLPKSFINIRASEDHISLFRWMRLVDDSMEPTLSNGDIVVFGLTEFDQRYVGIFVIEQAPGFTAVRRLEPSFEDVEPEDRWVYIKADSPHYSNVRTRLSKLKVIGRVLAHFSPVMR